MTEFILAEKVAELDLGKIDTVGKGILASFETTLNKVQIGRATPSIQFYLNVLSETF